MVIGAKNTDTINTLPLRRQALPSINAILSVHTSKIFPYSILVLYRLFFVLALKKFGEIVSIHIRTAAVVLRP